MLNPMKMNGFQYSDRMWVRFGMVWIVFFSLLHDAHAEHEPVAITDTNMALAIEVRLAQDHRVQENLIDVVVERGIVTLKGEVDNLLSQERASALAGTIKGVRSVINHIIVNPSSRFDDQNIRNQVQSALLENPATELYDMVIAVKDGRVYLTGTVQSWQEKQLALQVAKGVKGVNDVQDDLTINTVENRSDQAMKEEVIQRLIHDVWVDAESIDVMVQDGTVLLSGTVRSVGQKSRAIHLAWVHGITDVKGKQLTVDWSAREFMLRSDSKMPSDQAIKQAVNDALSYDPRVTKSDITIDVKDGLVTLTGDVETLYAKQAIEDDTHNTVGVYNVVNYLKVRWHATFSDDDIAKRVQDTFSRDPFLDREEIEVSVHNGTVILRGRVNSRYQQSRATTLAWGVKGAVNVINTLKHPVEWIWKSDQELRRNIEEQLWWSPFLSADSITVHVEHGVATLTGNVNSWVQRQIAEENSLEAGARSIHNLLRVRTLNHLSFFPAPEETFR